MDCISSSNHRSDFYSEDDEVEVPGERKDEEAMTSSAVKGVFYSEQDWERHSDVNNFDSDIEDNGAGDDADEDEIYDSTSIPKLQFRNDLWQARWNEDLSMAEVLKNKGKMATTTGVIREGKLLCSIEETLYLSERGALILEGPEDPVSLKDLYRKIGGEDCGCSWELFEAYRHLKSLGYIVVRHGVPWTMKSKKNQNLTSIHEGASNSKFRKSSPGNPSFKLHVCRGQPLSKHDIKILESKCEGVPLKICHVDHGRVSYLAFNEAQLPELPLMMLKSASDSDG